MPGRRSFKTDESFLEAKLLEDAESFYRPKLRPVGHVISGRFARDYGGAMPLSGRRSAIRNLKSEIKRSVVPHPARFPEKLPTFFIPSLAHRMGEGRESKNERSS